METHPSAVNAAVQICGLIFLPSFVVFLFALIVLISKAGFGPPADGLVSLDELQYRTYSRYEKVLSEHRWLRRLLFGAGLLCFVSIVLLTSVFGPMSR